MNIKNVLVEEVSAAACTPARFVVDGHHLVFRCCGKVLAIVPNESDNYYDIIACPFCGTPVRGGHDE